MILFDILEDFLESGIMLLLAYNWPLKINFLLSITTLSSGALGSNVSGKVWDEWIAAPRSMMRKRAEEAEGRSMLSASTSSVYWRWTKSFSPFSCGTEGNLQHSPLWGSNLLSNNNFPVDQIKSKKSWIQKTLNLLMCENSSSNTKKCKKCRQNKNPLKQKQICHMSHVTCLQRQQPQPHTLPLPTPPLCIVGLFAKT